MKENGKKQVNDSSPIEIKNWEEFEKKVAMPALEKKYLYRGHSQSDWKLESSLYRKKEDFSVPVYRQNVYYAMKMLESMTGIKWGLSIDNYVGRDGIRLGIYCFQMKIKTQKSKNKKLCLSFWFI
jgi:hypothetical protein